MKAFPRRPDGYEKEVPDALTRWLDLIPQIIKSDVYTPTLTNTTNIDSSTAFECPYIRVGNVVVVGIRFAADTTAGGNTATELQISLPIASDFTAANDAMGSANPSAISRTARISADTSTNRLSVLWDSTDTSDRAWGGMAIYVIK